MIIGQEANIKLIKYAVNHNQPVLLVGETGTGKTSLVYQLGEEVKKTVRRINLNGQTSVDEFLGKWLLKDKETVWQNGVLVDAMINGHWIVVDEINSALPEILFSLHSLLDDDRRIFLAEKNGEEIRPHSEFRFFATMNPSDEYAGTKELNKAFVSRFPVVARFEYPEGDIETRIITERTKVSTENASFLVALASVLRQAKKDGKIFYTCSTRDLINTASLIEEFGLVDAFECGIVNKAFSEKTDIFNILKSNPKFASILKVLKEYDADKNLDNLKKAVDVQLIKLTAMRESISAKEAVVSRAEGEARRLNEETKQKEKDMIERTELIKAEAVREFLEDIKKIKQPTKGKKNAI